MKTSKFQLKNGMTVILTESHKSPVVSVQMWVRTGSADEKKKEEGISHFIEHLVFKGTRKFGVGEIASTIEGAGGELNAYTSFDQTVFYVTISKQFADVGLTAIAEMMGFPKFDPKEIDNEREVVIEEIKRGKDSLSRAASEALFANNYRRHPYGIPVIGYDKNIHELSAKKIVNFYHSRYAPQNMFLVVSGDFANAEMKQKVQKLFGEFKDYKIKKVKRTPEPAQKQIRIKVEKTKFEQSLAYLSFKIPNVKHKDVPALDVLSMILGQGDSSRLVNKLRIESAIVNSIGASTYTPQDEGLFTISFGYNKEKLSQALNGIAEVLLQALRTLPTREEMDRAVLSLESEEFYSMETVDGLSRKMGTLEFYFRDQKAQEKYLKAVNSLKPADLLKVARKYIIPKTLSMSIATNEEKNLDKQLKEWTQIFAKEIVVASKKPIAKVLDKGSRRAKIKTASRKLKTETEKVVLKNGVTVLFRPSDEAQVISVKAAMLGGLREQPAGKDGLIELLGRTLACGTQTRNEQQISAEIESIAAGLGPVAGRNSVGLGLDVLSPFEERGAELFFDMLLNPTFPREAVEREKLVQLEQIKNRADNPAQTCGRMFMQTLFPNHPYALDMMGTEDSLRGLTSADLLKSWQHHLGASNLTFVVAGNFSRKFWEEQIEKHTAKLAKGKRLLQQLPPGPLTNDVQEFSPIQKEQSHVMFGFRGLSLSSKERYTLQIIQSILAGQGGRLFLELRDKNSLAYSVSPMRMEGIETGYFGAYIGCSPDKVPKALQMMREQFEILCTEKVPAQELQRAQRYLVGRHDIDLQRTGSIAAAILYNDIYGIDYNEAFTCASSYFAVTSEDILRLSQELFRKHSVVTVVGPS